MSGGKVVAWVDSRDLKERESFEVLACSDKYKGITRHELRYDTPLVLQSDLAAAIARAEAAERDAERYRWLRDFAAGSLAVRRMDAMSPFGVQATWMSGRQLDEAIDAAIAAQKAEGE